MLFLAGLIIGLINGVTICFVSLLIDRSLVKKGISFSSAAERIRPKGNVTLQEDLETPSETIDRLLDEDND